MEEGAEKFGRRPLFFFFFSFSPTATPLGSIKGRKKTVIYRSWCSSEVHRFPLTPLQFLLQCARPHATSPLLISLRSVARSPATGNAPRRPMRHGRPRSVAGLCLVVEEQICTCAWLLCLLHLPCFTARLSFNLGESGCDGVLFYAFQSKRSEVTVTHLLLI